MKTHDIGSGWCFTEYNDGSALMHHWDGVTISFSAESVKRLRNVFKQAALVEAADNAKALED